MNNGLLGIIRYQIMTIGLYISPRDMPCDLPESSFVKFLHLVISQKKNNKISTNGNKGLSNAMVIQL